MKKNFGFYIFLLIGISFLFINVSAAEMITYMGCGEQKSIPYDLPGFVRTIILIIQIAVPIILILIGSIDLVKVITGNDKDDLSKAIAKLAKRSIFAIMVFFSIFFVKLLLSLLGKDSDSFMACVSCFTSDENKCYTYDVEKVDNSEEKNAAKEEREDLEAKREEVRKENEKEAEKNKEESDKQHGSSSDSESGYDSTGISGTKTIYIGDSRTVQLCATLTGDWTNCQFENNGSAYVYNNNEFFVAQGSMGYDWFVNTVVPEVTTMLNKDPDTTYNIVSFMGVNGLGADKYDSKYKELANGDWKGHNIVLVSINPVEGDYAHMTSGIESFNNKIKSTARNLSNASYCDTYSSLEDNFGSSDGLHYDGETYKNIYSLTKTCITNSSKSPSTSFNCSKSGTYNGVEFCAPNPSYRFGSASATGGCNNKVVQHDSGYPLNTPVYAAIDGTIEYRQAYCGDELYSYGNYAILKGSDGTKIYYAHFNKFVEGIQPKVTKNCKWLSSNSPCPSGACSGGIKYYVLGTKTVRAGQLIGYSGTTGNSLGPHLHVEIHFKGGACLSDLNSAFGL